MVYAAIQRSTGQTIATGNTASEAYSAAIAAGYSPTDFTVVPVGEGPRI